MAIDDRDRKKVAIHRAIQSLGSPIVEEFEAILYPSWRGQLDLIKLLLSISAASLALVATFGQHLVSSATSCLARVLCAGSLSLLIATVVSAVLVLWRANGVAEFRLLLNAAAERLATGAVATLEEGAPAPNVSVEMNGVREQMHSALKWTTYLFRITLILFIAAFVALGALAWVSLDV